MRRLRRNDIRLHPQVKGLDTHAIYCAQMFQSVCNPAATLHATCIAQLASKNFTTTMAAMKRKAAAVMVLLLCEEEKGKKKNRKTSVRDWLSRKKKKIAFYTLMRELAAEDTSTFKEFVRMDVAQFNELVSLLEPLVSKQDTIMRVPQTSVKISGYTAFSGHWRSLQFLGQTVYDLQTSNFVGHRRSLWWHLYSSGTKVSDDPEQQGRLVPNCKVFPGALEFPKLCWHH